MAALAGLLGAGDLVASDGAGQSSMRAVQKVAAEEPEAVMLYFSAHWCPPCRAFTPHLIEYYRRLKAQGKKIEIVFVSSDHDQASFQEYFSTMPWLAIPLGDERCRQLSTKFGVWSIPTLVVVDAATGATLTKDGRGAVSGDGNGENFPYRNYSSGWCSLL